MATPGVPSGAAFPSRQEMGPLSAYVDNVRSLGANRGYTKYENLSQAYMQAQGEYGPGTYANLAEDPRDGVAPMVVLTDIPTSSTNYSRPRTIAAGYDPDTRTMTVVFRDGTFYNYYEVTLGEWLNFSASYSKGRPWLNRGFPGSKNPNSQRMDGLFIGKPRGVANMDSVSPALREKLATVARSQQIYQGLKRSRTNPKRVAGWEDKTGNKPFRTRTGYVTRANKGGANPAGKKR